MKILIIRNTVCNKEVVRKGQVITCDPQEGKFLIGMKKAMVYEEVKQLTDPIEEPVIEEEAKPENREIKKENIFKRGRSKKKYL